VRCLKEDANVRENRLAAALLVLLLTTGFAAACKHSGVAVTPMGQIATIEIEGVQQLAPGGTGNIDVTVRNVGITRLANTIIQVELPAELNVIEENRGRGMSMSSGLSPAGNTLYHYDVGDIQVGQDSKATFTVRADTAPARRDVNVRVLVWNRDIPGNNLLETHNVKIQ
jgi:hypothetical protein